MSSDNKKDNSGRYFLWLVFSMPFIVVGYDDFSIGIIDVFIIILRIIICLGVCEFIYSLLTK